MIEKKFHEEKLAGKLGLSQCLENFLCYQDLSTRKIKQARQRLWHFVIWLYLKLHSAAASRGGRQHWHWSHCRLFFGFDSPWKTFSLLQAAQQYGSNQLRPPRFLTPPPLRILTDSAASVRIPIACQCFDLHLLFLGSSRICGCGSQSPKSSPQLRCGD